MPLDYNSLLLAIGFAGAGLAISMFGSWLAQRTEGFLLTWAIGVGLVVAYGIGMALTLTSAGLLLVRARGLLDRRSWTSSTGRITRLTRLLPLATASVIVVAGLLLATNAAVKL